MYRDVGDLAIDKGHYILLVRRYRRVGKQN